MGKNQKGRESRNEAGKDVCARWNSAASSRSVENRETDQKSSQTRTMGKSQERRGHVENASHGRFADAHRIRPAERLVSRGVTAEWDFEIGSEVAPAGK